MECLSNRHTQIPPAISQSALSKLLCERVEKLAHCPGAAQNDHLA